MSDVISSDATDAVDHDHAWRRVDRAGDRYGIVGEYRCDLCPAVWSM